MELVTFTLFVIGGTCLAVSTIYNHFRVSQLEQSHDFHETLYTQCKTL